jgi:hypothetical protein
MYSELQRMGKDTVMIRVKALSDHLPGSAEDNHIIMMAHVMCWAVSYWIAR